MPFPIEDRETQRLLLEVAEVPLPKPDPSLLNQAIRQDRARFDDSPIFEEQVWRARNPELPSKNRLRELERQMEYNSLLNGSELDERPDLTFPKAIDISETPITTPDTQSTTRTFLQKLTGSDGQERYQLWPEKLAREGLEALRKAAGTFSDVLDGKVAPDSDEGLKAVTDLAMTFGMGGLATAPMRSGLGTFGGKLSRGIPAEGKSSITDLFLAEDMLEKGMSREQIFDATGWFVGKDNKFRFEINDSKAKFKDSMNYKDSLVSIQQAKEFKKGETLDMNADLRLGDIFDHPELYKHYPDAKNIHVVPLSVIDFVFGGRGFYAKGMGKEGTIGLPGVGDPQAVRSTLLHEIQHYIQDKEGFARGGNPEEFMNPTVSKIIMDVKPEVDDFFGKIERVGNRLDIELAVKRYAAGFYNDPPKNPVMEEIYKEQLGIVKELKNLGLYNKTLQLIKVSDQFLAIGNEAHLKYRRLYGEMEARNVQLRDDIVRALETGEYKDSTNIGGTPQKLSDMDREYFEEQMRYPGNTMHDSDAIVKPQR